MLNMNDSEESSKFLTKCNNNMQNGSNNERMNSSSFDSFLDSTITTSSSANGNETTSFETSPTDKQAANQSNLDFVDFIEVNNDLINDQEFAWLVDPKSADSSKMSKHQQQHYFMKQHLKNQENLINEAKNASERDENDTNFQSNKTPKIKNPYKWIMEEFEDKNLDKVKRTLLVALDDISKGFNRRSRSVSTSRTPYYQQQNTYNNSNFMYHQNQQQQTNDSMFNDFSDLSLKKQQGTNSQTVQQSKSIESLANESTSDPIDSYSNNGDNLTDKTTRVNNYSSATIVKKKSNNYRMLNPNVLRVDDSNLSTIESVDITDSAETDKSNQMEQVMENEQQLYEDIIDVQVIAKMQEETLRQSVLNINKIDNKNYNQPRGYSTATIVKRTHHGRPTLSNSNFDYENNQLRRDSASSSDHSSMSSTASNNGSPYASHVNVNEFFWDEDVISSTQNDPNNKDELNNDIMLASAKTCSCCTCAKSNRSDIRHNYSPLVPCHDHHVHYHHEPVIQSCPSSSSELINQNLKIKTKSNKKIHNHHLNFIELNKAKHSSIIEDVGFNNTKPVKMSAAQSTIFNKQSPNNYQTITKNNMSTQKMLNFAANSSMISTLTKSSLNSHSRSTTPSKASNPLTSSNSNILKHESRLPTPRSRGLMDGPGSGSLNKPPPSPLQTQHNVTVNTGRVGRAPLAYGGQRSATTSIVPMIGSSSSSSVNSSSNYQQSKFTKLQKQQQLLPKQPQQSIQQQQQQQRTAALSRTSTNQSISSSNSSNNITPNTNQNSTISPSSSSSVSTSSSMHQIAPMNSSSPRSRHTSPSLNSPYSHNTNNISNVNKIVISPSGLLTDGPLGRRPLISPSPLRDRSSSPVFDNKKSATQQQQSVQLINQLNVGSNSSLHTIQESKIPTSSPMLNKKQQTRKSFLPQPVHLQSQAVQSNQINQDSTNWKDGCY